MSDIQRPQLSLADSDRGKTPVFGLNLVRALAIILVILAHSIPQGALTTRENDIFNIFLLSYNSPLFFMISGALLLPVTGSYRRFLGKRLVRVWIPFIVWSFVYIALSRIYQHENDWWTFFQMRWFWLRVTFLAGWFVPAITALYLIYPVLSPWIKSASKRHLEYFLLLWLAAGTLPYISLIIGEIDYNLSLLGTFYGLTGFAVAGYYFINYPFNLASLKQKAAILSVCVAGGVILPLIFLQWDYREDVSEVFNSNFAVGTMCMGCIFFMFVVQVKSLGRFLNRIVSCLAANAYGMYLSHIVLIYYVRFYQPSDLAYSWWLPVADFFFALILTALIRRIPVIGKYIMG